MFITFWDFLIVEQISVSQQWNEALVLNCYIGVASRFAEPLKT